MKTWVLVLSILICHSLFSQSYEAEGLLFSQTGIPGTARTLGAGNAFGSVGADLGSLSINPAGIGLYRSTDMSITPALTVANNEADFNNSVKNQKNTKVSLNQAGIVFTKLFARKSNSEYSFNSATLNSFSFAINYHRQNAFSRKIIFEGYNPNNSAMDVNAYYINRTGLPLTLDNYPVDIFLAYQAYLLDYNSATGQYYSTIPSKVLQSGYINRRGATDQVDFTLGGNISDKLYFGAGLGIAILTYSADSYFDEYPYKDTATYWNGYSFQTNLRSTGVGVNARFGIIYRPASWMRFGVSYQIPTYYSLTENNYATLSVGYDTANFNLSAEGVPLPYKFRSPMRGVVSTSFYIKQHALISVDYEFLNNGATKYNFGRTYSDFSASVNTNIRSSYTYTHNIRLGVEGAFKTLRVRAGYNYTSTPYKKDQQTKGYVQDYHSASLGIGYRGQRFYADAAYVFGYSKDATYPYADFEVKNTLISHSVLLTIGWKINREAKAAKSKNVKQVAPVDKSY